MSQACELKKKCLKSDLHTKTVSHIQIPKLISSKQELEQACEQDAHVQIKTPKMKTNERKQDDTTSSIRPIQGAMTSIDSLQVEQEEQDVDYNLDADFIAEAKHLLEESLKVIDSNPECDNIEIKKEPNMNDEDNQSRVSTPSTLVMDYDIDLNDIDSISMNELKEMTRSICDLIPKDADDTLDEIPKASNQDEHVPIISSRTSEQRYKNIPPRNNERFSRSQKLHTSKHAGRKIKCRRSKRTQYHLLSNH